MNLNTDTHLAMYISVSLFHDCLPVPLFLFLHKPAFSAPRKRPHKPVSFALPRPVKETEREQQQQQRPAPTHTQPRGAKYDVLAAVRTPQKRSLQKVQPTSLPLSLAFARSHTYSRLAMAFAYTRTCRTRPFESAHWPICRSAPKSPRFTIEARARR